MALNCAQFEHRGSFADYVFLIQNATDGDISLAEPCATQICQVIWGTGNPDISGIGMIVGYIIENILGIVLTILCLVANSDHGGLIARHSDVVFRVFDSYFEYALFFCFSTELACAIMVTKVTFGLNADGMGNLTLRITWAAATLTILPLAYRFLIYNGRSRTRYLATNPQPEAYSLRRRLTFPLFCICWIISLYTFLNKMADTFGPSQIGDKSTNPTAVIDPYTWARIASLCDGDWDSLTPIENSAIDAFDIAAALLVSILTFSKLLIAMLKSCGVKIPQLFEQKRRFPMLRKVFSLLLLIIFPLLAVGLVWSIFRLQGLQNQLAETIGEIDPDDQWTFGQIVAVTVFTPVLVELICEIAAKWGESRRRVAV